MDHHVKQAPVQGVTGLWGGTQGSLTTASPALVGEDYSVDFSEPRFPLTAEEERKQWDWEWANGLSQPKDWMRKYNPDLTEDEIDDMMEEMQPEQPQQPTTLADILSS